MHSRDLLHYFDFINRITFENVKLVKNKDQVNQEKVKARHLQLVLNKMKTVTMTMMWVFMRLFGMLYRLLFLSELLAFKEKTSEGFNSDFTTLTTSRFLRFWAKAALARYQNLGLNILFHFLLACL